MLRTFPLVPIALGLTLIATAASVHAVELLGNGGFEADAGQVQSPDPITAWSTLEAGVIGSIAALSGTVAPGSGHATAGAFSGANYALLDLSQPAYSVLYQSFTIGAAGITGGQLGYSLFATSFANLAPPELAADKGLDYEAIDPMLTVRVDILKPGANTLTTSGSDIVATFLPTIEYFGSDSAPTGYTSYLHSLTSFNLLAGQTYTLRFAAAGNAGQALVGIDQVSIDVTPVPEPSTLALMAAGLALAGAAARRRAGASEA